MNKLLNLVNFAPSRLPILGALSLASPRIGDGKGLRYLIVNWVNLLTQTASTLEEVKTLHVGLDY